MRKLFFLLTLGAFAAALSGLFSGTARAADTIKIGLAAVQSGSDAQIGLTMVQGSQVAIDEWNAKGGVLGRKIESISLDDEGKPDKAVTVAQTLVDDGVVAVPRRDFAACSARPRVGRSVPGQ